MARKERIPSQGDQSRFVAPFRVVGASAGKDLVHKMERSTRKVIKGLIAGLQEELLATRHAECASPERDAGPRPAAGSRGPHAPRSPAAPSPRSGTSASSLLPQDRACDSGGARPALEEIQARFHDAVHEWKQLVEAMEEIEHEIAETTFENVFGNLFPAEADVEIEVECDVEGDIRAPAGGEHASEEPTPPAQEGPGEVERESSDTAAVDRGEAPDEPRAEERRRGDQQLELKLDQLIGLVRDHVLRGERVDAARLPSEWTRSVAREVANRLRESFPLSGELGAPRTGREAEQDAPPPRSSKISLDDVAAMIDEITGRNG